MILALIGFMLGPIIGFFWDDGNGRDWATRCINAGFGMGLGIVLALIGLNVALMTGMLKI